VSKHLVRVVDILAHQSGLHCTLINPRSRMLRDLGMDSLDLVEIEMEISEEFDVDFEFPRAEDYSVQDILDRLHDLTM
jgi:acyl carrier protein